MRKFEYPEIELIHFEGEDIIRTSGDLPEDDCTFGQEECQFDLQYRQTVLLSAFLHVLTL